MATRDKQLMSQLLRETILQLCKANSLYAGQMEIDGIICISGQAEGQELVVKVHESFGSPTFESAALSSRHSPYGTGSAFKDRYHVGANHAMDSRSRDFLVFERKRRRLESEFESDPLSMSAPFSYSSAYERAFRFGTAASGSPDNDDYRNSVKDLSMKALSSSPKDVKTVIVSPSDCPSDTPPPPHLQVAGMRDDVAETAAMHSSAFGGNAFHRHQKRLSSGAASDRWSPPYRPVIMLSTLSSVPECKLCGFRFDSAEALGEHNEAAHSVFTCTCCFKTFTSRSNLERHSRLHTGHKPYACAICGKAFSRKDHLSNHATKHAFKCGACGKRFSDRGALAAHYRYDHGGALLTDVCAYCNKGFASRESFDEHVKAHPQYHAAAHAESLLAAGGRLRRSEQCGATPATYACDGCGFSTSDAVTLVKHKLTHDAGGAGRQYTCRACGKRFNDPLQYSDHLTVHKDDPNAIDVFECCICHVTCSSLFKLRHHEMSHARDVTETMSNRSSRIDNDIEAHRCDRCNRSFDNAHILHEHMELHDSVDERCRRGEDGEENVDIECGDVSGNEHICSGCDERFSTLGALEQHRIEEHGWEEQNFPDVDDSTGSRHTSGVANSDTPITKKKKVPTATLR